MSITRAQRQRLKTENKKQSKMLTTVDPDLWGKGDPNEERTMVWRSQDFLVQEFQEGKNIRLSINRTEMQADGRWSDNISWDELQEIKRQVGYGDRYAVEIYPKDKNVVNVANMRHLWIPMSYMSIGWRN